MAEYQHLRYEKSGNIAWLTLNRTEALNALNSVLWAEIRMGIEEAEQDDEVRVVVLTGAGRAFSAGDDIKVVLGLEGEEQIRDFIFNYAVPTIEKVIETPKPVIAAVNGIAYGGGCELALVCDIVIAANNASFAVPEARIGAYPPIVSVLGPMLMGKLTASLIAMTGDPLNAKEAVQLGLANIAVPAEELKSTAEAIAARIMLSAPSSIAAIKKMLNKNLNQEWLVEAADLLVKLMIGEEGREGHRAFVEKRRPNWTNP